MVVVEGMAMEALQVGMVVVEGMAMEALQVGMVVVEGMAVAKRTSEHEFGVHGHTIGDESTSASGSTFEFITFVARKIAHGRSIAAVFNGLGRTSSTR